MNQRVSLYLLFAIVLSAVPIAWYFQTGAESSDVPQPAPAKLAQKKKEPLVVASDFDWENLTAKQLDEFSEYFGKAKSPNRCEVNASVRPGQTIIADVYEARPGEFVVSKMTPTLKAREDGSSVVEVSVDTFGTTLSGSQHQIFQMKKELPAKSVRGIGNHTPEGLYTLTMSAEVKGDPPKIRLKASGGFVRVPTPADQID